MKRAWIGIALLAGSWMSGLTIYHEASWLAWGILVAMGTLFLLPWAGPGIEIRSSQRQRPGAGAPWQVHLLCLLALLIPIIVLPWPFCIIPLFLFSGVLLCALPLPRRWPAGLGQGLSSAAAVLAAQAPLLLLYRFLTARCHDLPAWLGKTLNAVANLFGLTCSYDGANLSLFTMRKIHALGATWELFLDPVTACFAAGALAWLALRGCGVLRPMLVLAGVLVVWLPLRAVVLMALLIQRALMTGYDDPLVLMNQFWNFWLLLALLAVPVCLLWRFAPGEPAERGPRKAADPTPGAIGLLTAASFAIGVAVLLDPPGPQKAGRVLIDEYHSTWEPTQKPFDTTWYGHDAGYNYACLYDYLSRFYALDRLTNQISEATLRDCDVLILKVPTASYAPAELDVLKSFVACGGSLLLIGEHTDVFLTSSHLNQVARMFGFEYRMDCCFSIDGKFEQLYTPPFVPHPIVQHMPPMNCEVTCSIQPHSWFGRAAMLSSGLWNLPADYHASNFYPQVEDRADARYGSFIQFWTMRHGAGRVAAFTDSTIYSNFSVYEPGKLELALGSIEWLNHRNARLDPRPWLLMAGLAALVLGSRRVRHSGGRSQIVLSGALLGLAVSAIAVRALHRAAVPASECRKPMTLITVDRTVSTAPLSKAGFITASKRGFGIFEQWMLRPGYFSSRRTGESVFAGNVAVFLHPDLTVPEEFRKSLVRYVENGGKVLVFDSALNTASSANSLLYPFGLSFNRESDEKGTLETPAEWPAGVPAESCRYVRGGEPLVKLNGQPVAAVARKGRGTVVAVGFGSRFSDDNMGIITDLQPNEDLRKVFELEYSLLRHIVRLP